MFLFQCYHNTIFKGVFFCLCLVLGVCHNLVLHLGHLVGALASLDCQPCSHLAHQHIQTNLLQYGIISENVDSYISVSLKGSLVFTLRETLSSILIRLQLLYKLLPYILLYYRIYGFINKQRNISEKYNPNLFKSDE